MTLNPWQQFTTWLSVPGNSRRFSIGVISIVAVVAAVLFFSQLDFLLRLFGIKAEISSNLSDQLNWSSAPAMGAKRSNHALVYTAVKQSDGSVQYQLWALGGLQTSGNLVEALQSTEKLSLDQDGKPIGSWQVGPQMVFGHAAGRAIAVDTNQDGFSDWLYQIVGDMHVAPQLLNPANGQPLIQLYQGVYATIEKLDLHNVSAGWQIVSKVTDVHYLPEVAVDSVGTVHITGGIFGNIWAGASGYGPLTTNLDNPLMDKVIWDNQNLSSKPTVGRHPLYIHQGNLITQLPAGASTWPTTGLLDTDGDGLPDWLEILLGTDPTRADTDGDGFTDGQETSAGSDPLLAVSTPEAITTPDTTATPDVGVIKDLTQALGKRWQKLITRAQAQIIVPPTAPDYGKIYAQAITGGRFFTTVEAHISFSAGSDTNWLARELTIDAAQTTTSGTPINYDYPYATTKWDPDVSGVATRVVKIGLLRVFVQEELILPGDPNVIDRNMMPVPQGRYGHQLTVVDGKLTIFGGASIGRGSADSDSPFWVLDDGMHPRTSQPSGGQLAKPYRLAGHAALQLNGNGWYATSFHNGAQTGWLLPSTYVPFIDVDKRGGLFMPALTSLSNKTQLAGGLSNESSLLAGRPIVRQISQSFNGSDWVVDDWGGLAATNDAFEGIADDNQRFAAMSVSINDRAIVAGGLQSVPFNFFYPAYNQVAGSGYTRVFGYSVENGTLKRAAQWMWPFLTNAPPEARRFEPMAHTNLIFPAAAPVTIDRFNSSGRKVGTVLAMYLTGGSASTGGLPSNSSLVEYIGPLYSGSFGQPQSATLEADRTAGLYADDIDKVELTATLFDENNKPVEGVKTWIAEYAKTPGGAFRQDTFSEFSPAYPIVDSFGPPESFGLAAAVISDADGQIKLNLTSAEAGDARLFVTFELTEGAWNYAAMSETVVSFRPLVTAVSPASGVQGTHSTVEVVGKGVEFNQGAAIYFVKPGGFVSKSPSTIYLTANGTDAPELSVKLMDNRGPLSNVNVTFNRMSSIVSGHPTNGQFVGDSTVKTDLQGMARVTYRAGTLAGLTYIEATALGVPPVRFLVVEADPSLMFYQLEIISSDAVLEPGKTANVTAYLRLSDGSPAPDGSLIHFVSNDQGASFTPDTQGTVNGASASLFNPTNGTQPNSSELTAWTEIGSGTNKKFLAAPGLSINKLVGGSAQIVWDKSKTLVDPHTVRFGIDIGAAAPTGPWQVLVLQSVPQYGAWIFTWLGPNPSYQPQYFEVLPAGQPNVPQVTAITPNKSDRGRTLTVSITGTDDTNFDVTNSGYTTVTFTPSDIYAPTDIGDPTGVKATNVIVDDLDALQATLEISPNATPGWWNVEVVTEIGTKVERAAMLISGGGGEQDFLVTVPGGYLIDLRANPTQLVPDGRETSALTATVGRLDNASGSFTRIGGRTVAFDKGTDGGAVQPIQADTNTQGKATSTYTVNTTPGVATITARASAVNGGPLLTASVQIYKTVATHDLDFTVVANPTAIDLAGNQLSSTITVTLRQSQGGSDTVPADQKVDLVLTGGGSFANNQTKLPIVNGVATTTYLADDTEGIARIDARAVVPNVGPITTEGTANGTSITKTRTTGPRISLTVTVPLEGSAYDYTTADSVYVFVLVAGGQSPVIDGVYKLSATRQVVGLPQIAVLAGRVYDVWVKPAQHLAVVASFIGGTSAVNVTTQPTALIGDIDFIRDNTINALDFAVFQQEYARTPVFGDFNHNTFVDALDFVFLFNNFFESGQRRPGT